MTASFSDWKAISFTRFTGGQEAGQEPSALLPVAHDEPSTVPRSQVMEVREKVQQPQTSLTLYQPSSPFQLTRMETYFDEELRTHYFVPISFNEVSAFVEKIQTEGNYCGLTCSRKTRLKNLTKQGGPVERCDIIALTKSPQQVRYEAKSVAVSQDAFQSLRAIWEKHFHSEENLLVKTWQTNQVHAIDLIMRELPSKIEKWHYDSFMIADERILLRLEYPRESAKKMHMLVLFYKKVPVQP